MKKIAFLTTKNIRKHNLEVFLLLSCALYACEGYRCADGTIYDSQTNVPIDSVKCIVLTGDETQYSDRIGRYSVCNNMEGCIPDCSDIMVEYSKDGYKTQVITNPNKSDIYLERK